MKNATRYCAGPAYYRMCFNRLPFKTNRQVVAPKETITHHFFVSGIGQKKTVDAARFVAAQKMLLKQKPSKHS